MPKTENLQALQNFLNALQKIPEALQKNSLPQQSLRRGSRKFFDRGENIFRPEKKRRKRGKIFFKFVEFGLIPPPLRSSPYFRGDSSVRQGLHVGVRLSAFGQTARCSSPKVGEVPFRAEEYKLRANENKLQLLHTPSAALVPQL